MILQVEAIHFEQSNTSESNFYSLSGCTQCQVTEDVDNEIDTSIPEKSKYILDFNDSFAAFKLRIASLQLNQKTNNEIYKLCGDLVKQTQNFNAGMIEEEPDADPIHILSVSTKYLCGKFREYSTVYRRKKKCDENPLSR